MDCVTNESSSWVSKVALACEVLYAAKAHQPVSSNGHAGTSGRITNTIQMKNKYLKVLQAAVVGAFALASLPSANAVPTLTISQTGGVGAPITVVDQVLVPTPDMSGVAGSVVWIGSIGNWSVVVTSGTTKPLNGSATAAELHLGVTATSTGGVPSTLTVSFSEDFFGPVSGAMFAVDSSTTIDPGPGNTGESVVATANFDSSNALFGAATVLNSSTFITPPGAQATNLLSAPQTAAVYSLTGTIVISHNAGTGRSTTASVDIVQSVPDGGFTLSLLGGAMVGLAAIRRKFMTA